MAMKLLTLFFCISSVTSLTPPPSKFIRTNTNKSARDLEKRIEIDELCVSGVCTDYEVIVIGGTLPLFSSVITFTLLIRNPMGRTGGPSGLQTTMSLGRLRRKILMVDDYRYRNAVR